jgi:hypothetical protein
MLTNLDVINCDDKVRMVSSRPIMRFGLGGSLMPGSAAAGSSGGVG